MDKLLEFRELAFGSRMKRLSETLMRDVKQVYKSLYLDFDPTLFPVFKTISDEKSISTGEISEYLQITQPAVTQFINSLMKRELVIITPDINDKRKKNISLSEKGSALVLKLDPIWKIMEEELTAFIKRPDTSLMNHIRLTEQNQRDKPLYQRIMQRIRNSIEIIDYDSEYAKDFLELNLEWLETYFYVEPHDTEVLENPQSYILDNKGYIFFARFNNEIVGTVALINEDECYELSKMAVSPKYRGMKIGQQLMDKCIEFSKQQGWEKIMLYSNRSLTPAINLYRKVGFYEVPVENEALYERADIKMILEL
ncbi:bifunctional helix-turn-helix transcriptional regulator/GNAT family N-acetyltransferase [Flavobacteriaceae bacterium S356]|uniref:Bifunctional helix-turn-helix transcriptional regulator/GNAT family N-acetyltransferase n=1 Tax=Asprobacillus argus TaxID=3076534 RepID=A0ABU3LEE7_9FLAO|nr:bifunctional helix-turn-helix transcriptional regulator/GNAT family N-acetyltransferase [Flavobacteriaceae bacterium S356]